MANAPMRGLDREIVLALWKVHILCHAAEGPIYGQWISEELRRHGYAISPGTLYPLLRRMEANGWLVARPTGARGAKARREYVLTREGARALAEIRTRVEELHRELVQPAPEAGRRGRGESAGRSRPSGRAARKETSR